MLEFLVGREGERPKKNGNNWRITPEKIWVWGRKKKKREVSYENRLVKFGNFAGNFYFKKKKWK